MTLRVLGAVLRLAAIPLVLLVPAGTAAWWEAWAQVGIWLGFVGVEVGLLAWHDPALLAERLKGSPVQAGQPGWDKALMVAMLGAGVAMVVVPGLDVVRFGWSEPLPPGVEVAGMLAQVPAYGLVLWVMWTNTWLARVVKVDQDRGHEVITTGPYAWVRHPMYVGVIVAVLATPVALGSRWALVPAGIMAALIVARTALEDRMLHAELRGYPEYAANTRYRLLPGLW